MSIFAVIAGMVLAQQPAKAPDLEAKIASIAGDLRQSLTLLDALKLKVKTEQDLKKLFAQFSEKMEAIAKACETTSESAKTIEQKAKLAVIRFEALANTDRSAAAVETIAVDLANKYRESPAICPALEDLIFFQYLSPERYGAFDTAVRQAKNPEVVASALLSSYFIQFLSDAGDVNKFRALSVQFEKTKAGQRAAKVYDIRTKLVLGQPMLDLDLEFLNGTKTSVKSMRGKVVVLNFWGFWNEGSSKELSDIKDYVAKYPTRLSFIGINTDNWTSSFVSQRIKDVGVTWPNVASGSPTGRLPMDFGITAYPAKIIIDQEGIVRYVPSVRDWRPVLDELLGKN